MTKEEAIMKTYKHNKMLKYRNPTMVSWNRIMTAMDLYADDKVFEISSKASTMNWVALPEKPKENGHYLLIVKGYLSFVGSWDGQEFKDMENGDNVNPTHWMQLPNQPNE